MQLCWENKVNGLLLSCFVRQYKLNVVKIVYGKQFGLVAQLGERSVRIREVEGSNPFESTISKASGYTTCLAFVSIARIVSFFLPLISSGSLSRYSA